VSSGGFGGGGIGGGYRSGGGAGGPGGRGGSGGRGAGAGGAGGRGGKDAGKRYFFRRRKVCKFCADKIDYIDYKDVKLLSGFVPERGKILPRRMFGTCAEHQRKLTLAIKRARNIALLPFAAD
jgi:small subunit ribosomal protein S18